MGTSGHLVSVHIHLPVAASDLSLAAVLCLHWIAGPAPSSVLWLNKEGSPAATAPVLMLKEGRQPRLRALG